jgi:hypothetical protein
MVDIDYNIVTYVNQVFMLLICEEAGLQQKIVKFKQIGTIFRRRLNSVPASQIIFKIEWALGLYRFAARYETDAQRVFCMQRQIFSK